MMELSKASEILEAVPLPAVIVMPDAPDFTIRAVNDTFLQATNTQKKDLLDKSFIQAFQVDAVDSGIERLQQSFKKVIETGKVDEFESLKFGIPTTGEGKELFWSSRNMPVLNKDGSVAFIIHIAQKVNKIAPYRIEKYRDKTYRQAKIGSWVLDVATGQLYWSSVVKEIHEVPDEFEPNMETGINFYSDEHLEVITKAVQEAIGQGKPYALELKIITAKGNERWVRTVGEPEMVNGECIRLYGSFQNIDQQKRAEELLKLSEQRFKALVQDGSDLIAILDAEFNYTYVSPTSESILGISPERFIGTSALDYIHPEDQERIASIIEKLPSEGQHKSVPFRFKNASGDWEWIETILTNKTEDPAINGFVANSRVVTQQIEREAELKASLERYDYVLKASNDIIYDWDIRENEIIWDESFKSAFEHDDSTGRYTLEDWVHNVHAEDRPVVKESLDAALQNNNMTQWEAEYRFAKKGGSFVNIYERGFIIRNNEGEAVRMIGSLQNITERKQAVQELKNTEQKLRELVEHSTIMFYKHTSEHVLTYVSPQSVDFLGYSPEESMVRWTEFVTDNPINQKGYEVTQRAIETGEAQPPHELELKKRDGEIIWVSVNEAPITKEGKTVSIVGSLTNITEQKQYEEELKELSLVASKTTDVIIIKNPDDSITWVNDAFEKLTGYTFSECVGKKIGNLLHGPDTTAETVQRLNRTVENRKAGQAVILNYTKSGRPYWVDVTIDPVFDEEGNCTKIVEVQKDVTMQIKRENKLRESLERYNTASKATTDTIWDLDINSGTLRYSDNIYDMFGYSIRVVEDKDDWWQSKINPDDLHKVLNDIDKVMHNDARRLQLEYRFKCADGTYKNIYDRAFVVTDEQGNSIRMIGAMQDVTAQKEQQKIISEALKEKETLLAEVHHRVKNNLAVVAGMMQLQALEEENEALADKLLDSVARISSMATIHEQLYQSNSFSKLNFSENLRTLAAKIIDTIQSTTKIELKFKLEVLELNVNQAIPCSLIVNEAVTNIVKHAFIQREKGCITLSLMEKEGHITLSVKDNGTGLPDSFMAEKYEKSLGLNLIDTLARQLEAEYSYESPGEGTVFCLRFKRAELKGIGSNIVDEE